MLNFTDDVINILKSNIRLKTPKCCALNKTFSFLAELNSIKLIEFFSSYLFFCLTFRPERLEKEYLDRRKMNCTLSERVREKVRERVCDKMSERVCERRNVRESKRVCERV